MAGREGAITFDLVPIPVDLNVAARPLGVAANPLHSPCRSRIRPHRFCSTCERTVPRDELRGDPINGGHVVLGGVRRVA